MKFRYTRTIALSAALIGVITVASVLVSGVLLADQPVPFPGNEAGARAAANEGLASRVDARAEANGLTLQIVGFVADETQTMVSYVLKGREAEGNTAFGAEPPVLIDAEGNAYECIRASADASDHRKGTWVFPGITPAAGTVSLAVGGFQLGIAQQGKPVAVTDVPGTWKVAFEWNGKKAPEGPKVDVPSAAQPFGNGSIRIDGIVQEATGTVVRGTLIGFSPNTIQSMSCPASNLQIAAGGVEWIACRMGFGDGLRSFEVTYPLVKGKVELSFLMQFGDESTLPTVQSEQVASRGATASFDIDLPAR
jgi:hypothetical protein